MRDQTSELDIVDDKDKGISTNGASQTNISENDPKTSRIAPESSQNNSIKNKEEAEPSNQHQQKSQLDFFDTDSLDCSSLSGYVENALLASSANNTLDRNASLNASTIDTHEADLQKTLDVDAGKSDLCVQYVTFDFLAEKSVDGLSSDGSSECYNSNEDISEQRKSEREIFVNSLLEKEKLNPNNNNNNAAVIQDKVFTTTNQDSNSKVKPEATDSSKNFTSESVLLQNNSDNKENDIGEKYSKNISNIEFFQHSSNCPFVSEDETNTTDMNKAKNLFGLCLCQNGEATDEERVTDLDFRNCNLKQVPVEIFQFTNTLQHLQLDSNTLSDLPKALFSCVNLKHLSVSDNDLGSLPSSLAGLTSLSHLDISKNVIEDVPDCIRCCKSLEVLDASVNPIERLSEGFTQLVGLKELYLNDCFLEFLPASFGRLVHLNVLELRDNQLQILPKSIRRLTLLKRLDLGGNVFQEWPDVISQLLKLTELWLDGNELNGVPRDLGDLTSLVYLDISRNFVEDIPSQIGSLTDLTDLLLCENHISKLPDTIGFLEKLTMLKVSMNQLSEVPESIGKLAAIEELDLSHNKLEVVPATIGNLKEMHTCLLDNNALTSIPSEIGNCSALKILQLSRNQLEAIPSKVGDLSELRVLNICRNKLPHLPISIIKLAKLEALWVSSNQSKPNVPLHAELAPSSKARILTNILFPQKEGNQVLPQVDEDGYAYDIADDDDKTTVKKTRGVTRVAFNLETQTKADTEDEDDYMEIDSDHESMKSPEKDQHAIEVNEFSKNLAKDNSSSNLIVKIPPQDAINNKTEEKFPDHFKHHFHKHTEPKDDIELLHSNSLKRNLSSSEDKDALLFDEGNERNAKESRPLLPDRPPNGLPVQTPMADNEIVQVPKIKTWSSRSNLPSCTNENGEIIKLVDEHSHGNIKTIDDSNLHFVDSDENEYSSKSKSALLPETKSPNENYNVIPTKENKPHPNNDIEGMVNDRDSGVGNDVDSQESIPECPDDERSLPSSPMSSSSANKSNSITISLVKSPAKLNSTVTNSDDNLKPTFNNNEKSKTSPKKLPIPSHTTVSNKKSANSVFENIKKFETISTNIPQANMPKTFIAPSSNLNTNKKLPEEKAIIPPNNHLNGQSIQSNKMLTDCKDKINNNKVLNKDNTNKENNEINNSDVIIKSTSDEIVFADKDDNDLFAFSKVESKTKKAPTSTIEKNSNKMVNNNSSSYSGKTKRRAPPPPPLQQDSTENTKHQQFRSRLEKIMQQQRNVAMQASQATQNITQSEMIQSFSRKSSLSAISSSEVADESGLENLTADTSTFSEEKASAFNPTNSVKKGPLVYERMKSKLTERKPISGPASKVISRVRPGSAPAMQLQRKNSSQRNSVSEGDNKLATLNLNDNKGAVTNRSRSKSIEQQLGQLLLTDSDEGHDEIARHNMEKRVPSERDDRLRHNMLANAAKLGISGSRSSLVSPPPVRHNMYAKARSSTNPPPPVSDWKYKLLQHIEKKRQEKVEHDQITKAHERIQERSSNRQSIGHIKSPPKTNVVAQRERYLDSHAIYADPYRQQGMTKSSTAPVGQLSAPQTNNHFPRSHSSSNNRISQNKPPKHRTYTPGPEHSNAFNEGIIQPQVSRPKSAMEKYTMYDEHIYDNPKTNILPTYKDHLQRHKATEVQQIIPHHLESDTKNQNHRHNTAGYPLRSSGSHDSLMENYARNDKPTYYRDNPIRTTSSHDSILDQLDNTPYYDGYQDQQPLISKPQYRPPVTSSHNQPQVNHVHQHKRQPSHTDYTSPDHATYVNLSNYQQQATKTPPSYNQFQQRRFYNKPPVEPPEYISPTFYQQRNAPEPRHQYAHPKEPTHPHHYREEESVASAFRPYEKKHLQPPSYHNIPHKHMAHTHMPHGHMHQNHIPHNPNIQYEQLRYQRHQRMPSNGPPSYGNYMEAQNVRRQSPTMMWNQEDDYEMLTVSIRRNPTFGFHVMGGVGAGGNPYCPNDDGVYITHVTPGGAADGKLQAGDKIILVNGSKFVGISHKRAVDMLRNAGHMAILVVERSLGKAV